MKPFEIFRTGQVTSSQGRKLVVTAAMLASLASNYTAVGEEAPIVVGHPQSNTPAHGWIDRLSVEGDRLIAHPKQVHADFSALVESGAYKKRSISLFTPDHPSNPKPGDYYLRHVGFLGGAAPAIAGLSPVEFSAEGDVFEFQAAMQTGEDLGLGLQWIVNGLRKMFATDASFAAIEAAISDPASFPVGLNADVPSLSPTSKDMDPMKTNNDVADFAAQQDKLKKDREALDAQLAEFAAQQTTIRAAEDMALIDSLEKAGKLAPAAKAGLAEFMASLSHDEPFEFAASDGATFKQPPRQYFRNLLSSAQPVINFSEVSKDEAGADTVSVDPKDAAALSAAALEYQAQASRDGRTITIDMAVTHVAQANKVKSA